MLALAFDKRINWSELLVCPLSRQSNPSSSQNVTMQPCGSVCGPSWAHQGHQKPLRPRRISQCPWEDLG